MPDDDAPLAYYARGEPDPSETVLAALAAAGRDTDQLAVDDLAAVDEFHALGRPATLALARLAGVEEHTRVVDVGAGLGGPARVLASRFGARVIAVEPVERFRRACAELTARAGLADRVEVVEGTATDLPVPDGVHDVAWMQAVAISVPDKDAMARELRRVLAPGGRLAFFDSTATGAGDLHFPLPWADGAAESFVATADELRAAFERAGFGVEVWNETGGAGAEIAQHPFTPTVDPGQVGLQLLMPDFETRMGNVARNIQEGRLALLQAVLRAA